MLQDLLLIRDKQLRIEKILRMVYILKPLLFYFEGRLGGVNGVAKGIRQEELQKGVWHLKVILLILRCIRKENTILYILNCH